MRVGKPISTEGYTLRNMDELSDRVHQAVEDLYSGAVATGYFRCARKYFLAQSIGMEVTYELTQRDFFDSLIAHRNRSD